MKEEKANPLFFSSQFEFRKWLKENHDKEKEIIVGFHKVGTGKPSLTWSESVDQALCYGWIDGIRRSIDEESYCIRFTPRNPKSRWSAVNVKKVEALIKKKLMTPQGLALFNLRKDKNPGSYSFERDNAKLSNELEKLFKTNKAALNFFTAQAKSYQKTIIHWIMSAKQESTRITRLNKVITESEQQKRLYDNSKRKKS